MKPNQIADYMFAKVVRKYGWLPALGFLRNLGIGFDDAYYMAFGKEAQR